MSSKDSWQPRNCDVTDMQRLDPVAIWQINNEGFSSNAFVDDIDTIHDENGHCARVRNGVVTTNGDLVDNMLIRRIGRRGT